MSVGYRLIALNELDAALVEAWRSIQRVEERLESPYFCPEFTRLVGSVRDDVRIVVIENDGRPVGFFPHQRAPWGRGKPVGGPLSDYHGVIAAPGSDRPVTATYTAKKIAPKRTGFAASADSSAARCDWKYSIETYWRKSRAKNATTSASTTPRTAILPLLMGTPRNAR